MLRRLCLIALVSVLAPGWMASQAAACDGAGWWSNFPARQPLRTGNVPTPPYFALHPPVYYGERVRRSYGDSPYAYPAQRPRATASAATGRPTPPKPKLIVNPYYVPATGEAAGSSVPANGQLILNPYCQPSSPLLADK